MKLYESPDFRQLVTLVAAERQVAETWIEKDYYLTEVLRIIAQVYPTQSMLKGGTSLSKGWQLLDRISEDIDLFVDPTAFPAGVNKKVIGAKNGNPEMWSRCVWLSRISASTGALEAASSRPSSRAPLPASNSRRWGPHRTSTHRVFPP